MRNIIFTYLLLGLCHAQLYRGAELRTLESVLYGKFEVRYKPAQGDGVLSSFFTYNDNCCDESPWNEIDIDHSQREIERSLRYISESAELLSGEHLLVAVDNLGVAAGVGQIPSMKKMKLGLENAGYRMARCHMPEAMFATDADWETVLNVAKSAE